MSGIDLREGFFETPPGFYMPLNPLRFAAKLQYHFELGYKAFYSNGTSSDAVGDDALHTLRLDIDVQTATLTAAQRPTTMIRAFPLSFISGETLHAPAGATTVAVRAHRCFKFRRDVLVSAGKSLGVLARVRRRSSTQVLVLGLRLHTHSRGLLNCLTAGDVSVCRHGNVTNNWKWLDAPVLVPAGEKASFNCTYDLTGPLGRKITHGFAGSHEMCIAYLAVAVPESRSNGAIYFNDRSLASHGNYGPGGCWIQGGE